MSSAKQRESNDSKYASLPRITKVLDGSDRVIINRGEEDGVREGRRYLIFALDEEEIFDPKTGDSLGRLELVKGKGKIIHVQEKLAILESEEKRTRTIAQNRFGSASILGLQQVETIEELVPFRDPRAGDFVKPI